MRTKLLLSIIFATIFSCFFSRGNAQNFQMVGYATQSGGTTGGQGGTTVTVNTGTDLQNAIKNKGSQPLTIYVNGTITPSNSGSLTKIDVKDASDISIIGVGTSGEFNGIGIKVNRASNIIIQNLKVHHVDIGDKDCISIEGPADHVWVDHCELYNEYAGVNKDYYDGLLDAKGAVDYITFSWNYLHDSWKASLSGSSDSDSHARTITYHHNYFENINSRLPLFRFGYGHVFNNYYKGIESTGINSRMGACVKIENNYFENALNPYVTAYSSQDGYGDISGNILVNSTFSYSSDTRELPACNASIPYSYSGVLDPADAVPSTVQQYAGVGKLDGGTVTNQYSLTTGTAGSGSVTTNPSGSVFDEGTTVTVTATPAQGWEFSGWTGDATGTSTSVAVTMNGNKNVTATFTQITTTTQYTLSVAANGNGTISKSPDNAAYDSGTNVTLTATPASGYQFSGWSGDASGTQNPLSLTMNSNKSITATFTATDGGGDCNSATKFGIMGYATLNGGTTGGQGGTSVTVSTGTDLQNAIKNKGASPLTIYVNGTITPSNSGSLTKIDIKDVSDISIIGVGTSGEFNGIGLKVNRASNIIIQNLKVHHVDIGDKDCISIEGPADHVWVDHCELYNEYAGVDKDYYDGLLDAKGAVDNLTFSWNYLHDSWKASLSGSSDSDVHDRTITYHHNYFENINSRLPLFRFGKGHVFNNYYKGIESTGINSRMGACVKIENNYFENALNPYVSAYSSQDGYGDISGNQLVNSTFSYSSDTRELTACTASIPYPYAEFLQDASTVPATVVQYAGVGKLGMNPSSGECPTDQYSLTINISGSGTVSKSPESTTYEAGSSVTLTANPELGWEFTGWSGDYTGTDNPATITMNGNKNIVATFTQSNTGLTTIQAENACSYTGILETKNAGFNGENYVNTDNASGVSIVWAINALSGSHELNFRYANGGTTGRSVRVLVNGAEQISNVDFPATGAWTTWNWQPINLNLISGNNMIEFIALTSDGAANIDEISVSSDALSEGNCTVTGTKGIAEISVNCYPNPFAGGLTIESEESFTYTILDTKGIAVETGTADTQTEVGKTLQTGLYIIKVETERGIKVFKVTRK